MKPRYIAFDLSIFIAANLSILYKYNSTITVNQLVNAVEKQLHNLLRTIRVPIKQWVLCADSNSFRKVLYKHYKANRKYDMSLMQLKNDAVSRLAKTFNVIKFNGMEGDDLLYLYTKKYKPSTIISNDGDCKLMLTEGTNFYRYRSGEWFEYDELEKTRIKIQKVFKGDKKDNIPDIIKKRGSEKLLNRICKEMENKSFIDICKFIRSKYSIDNQLIVRNVFLTIYDESIYDKHLGNFKQKLNAI